MRLLSVSYKLPENHLKITKKLYKFIAIFFLINIRIGQFRQKNAQAKNLTEFYEQKTAH